MGIGDMRSHGIGDRAGDRSGDGWERRSRGLEDSGCDVPRADGVLAPVEPCSAKLIRTIEAEIVPRLVLAQRQPGADTPARVQAAKLPDVFDVDELVRLLLAHDLSVAADFVSMMRQRGTSLDGICLNLLAPAARALGLLWEEDEVDFMQVTVGLCRLHQLLHNLAPHVDWQATTATPDRRILLCAVPGEQHTFGISLVAQFLRRAGWDVWQEFPSCNADILEIVRHNWFTIAGLSVGNDSRLEDVSKLVKSIRNASRNRAIGVLVGGPVLVGRPDLASLVGADATALDGRQAVDCVARMSPARDEGWLEQG